MSLRALTVKVVLVELIGLGLLFTYLVAFAVANDGRILLDLTRYGEMWVEYVIALVLTAVAPYVLYLVDDRRET